VSCAVLVEKRGGETFIAAEVLTELLDEAERRGVGILGLEGFIIGDATYPSLSRIADFSTRLKYSSADFVRWSCEEARRLVGSSVTCHCHAATAVLIRGSV